MKPCKCGSYAINHGWHGRVAEKHSDLCDVCYWRAEAAQARADALRWVLGQIGRIEVIDTEMWIINYIEELIKEELSK